jgi:hypothetical protein
LEENIKEKILQTPTDNVKEEEWIEQEKQIRENKVKEDSEKRYDEELETRRKMEYEKEMYQRKQAEELINNGHKRILFERDRTPQNLNEKELDLKIIDSLNSLERKEALAKKFYS